jgi:membrane associated rhomboid family serine protease
MIPLYDSRRSGRFPFVTLALIATNSLVFFHELTLSTNAQAAFVAKYALVPAMVALVHPLTWLPLLTAAFLHDGWLHILGNMIFLWVFGNNVEAGLKGWYLPFYVCSGVFANFVQYLTAPHSTLPVLGASGAIAAVLGAYLILFPRNRIKTLLVLVVFFTIVDAPAWILLAAWFLLQVFDGVSSLHSSGGVAYFAHVGGFAAGVAVALVARTALFSRGSKL